MENYISTNTASGPNSKTKIEPFTKLVVLFATLAVYYSATTPV